MGAPSAVVNSGMSGNGTCCDPKMAWATFCSRMETPIAEMSAARRGALRRGRYARRSMTTPMIPTTTMAMRMARKKFSPGMPTVWPNSVISVDIIMMVMKAPNMKSSPKAKLMSSMMP